MANEAKVDTSVLIYDRDRVKDSYELLREIKNDFYEVDNLLYNSVMSVIDTKGFDLIENGNFDIDMRMPEKLVEQCRETNDTIMGNLTKMSQMVEGIDLSEAGVASNIGVAQFKQIEPVPSTAILNQVLYHKTPYGGT